MPLWSAAYLDGPAVNLGYGRVGDWQQEQQQSWQQSAGTIRVQSAAASLVVLAKWSMRP